MNKTRVIIVDDSAIIRNSLKLMLGKSEGIHIIDEASDGEVALNLIEKNNYDVVLMDINMPNVNGIEATKNIRKINSNIKILTNSCNVSAFYVKEMIEAGASGYITKGDDIASYVEAIWTVHNGGIYLSDEIDEKTYNKVFGNLKFSKTNKHIVHQSSL